MKAYVKRLLRGLLKGLSRRHQVWLFRELARLLEIPAAELQGQNGALLGYIQDTGIFRAYAWDRCFFGNAIDFINEHFREAQSGTFLDIGANIGAVVVPIAKSNPHVSCYAFEPEPGNYLMLQHNIIRNGVSVNVKPFNIGLATERGSVQFELDGENYGDHRIRITGGGAIADLLHEDERRTIDIQVDRLDALVPADRLLHPVVIKLDVQGAEALVVSGGASIFEKADLLFLEYWPYGMRRLESEPHDLIRVLASHFAFGAFIRDGVPIYAKDFMPIVEIVPTLQKFAEELFETGHINLALSKHATA